MVISRKAATHPNLERILAQWADLEQWTSAPTEETTSDERTLQHRRDQLLRALDFIYSDQRDKLDNALKIIDEGRLRCVKTPIGRQIFVANGSNRKQHYCFGHSYCSCRSFLELAKKSAPGAVMCKHLLAVRISPYLRPILQVQVSEDEVMAMIQEVES